MVGESGCGKSTLSRAVLNLLPATGGAVTVLGRDLTHADQQTLRAARKDLQIVFQDPLASLDPRATVGDSIAEPLRVFRPGMSRAERQAEAAAMMVKAGLSPDLVNRYPHELSGGQNQRVGIARAMILGPQLVICDEAVSALDVSIRAQIIDLLIELQREMGLAMMFISHDLAVVREISHRVLVLYLGRVMEMATRDQLYQRPAPPLHPGAAGRRADPRPGARASPPAGAPRRRAAEPARSARALALPALQAGRRTALRAAADRSRARPPGQRIRPRLTARPTAKVKRRNHSTRVGAYGGGRF